MKYALVTGGSRGLGRAVSLKLAAMNWPVIINYQSNSGAAEETKRLIEEQGGQAELLRFDVSKKEEVEAALDQWEAAHEADYIAVLVNNAGIRRDNVMFMMGDEEWHSVLDTSLNGFFYTVTSHNGLFVLQGHDPRYYSRSFLRRSHTNSLSSVFPFSG